MTKLTVRLRGEILENVLSTTFKDRIEALREKKRKVADTVYRDVLGKKNITLMESLPKGFLPERDEVRVAVDGDFLHLPLGEPRRVISEKAGYNAWKNYTHDSVIGKQILEVRAAEGKLNEDYTSLRSKAQTILNSVTTVKSLLATWPEVSQFLPANPDVVANLPAIPVEELNKTIAAMREAA